MQGTPGFVGRRLIQCREARGLTAVALADLIGVKSANISNYEHDKQSPSPAVMEKLVHSLNHPHSRFLIPAQNIDMRGIAFRSVTSATRASRLRAQARFEWLKEITRYLAEYLDFPRVRLPVFKLPPNPAQITMGLVEDISMECRSFWKLADAPLGDSVLLMESNGVIVSRGELGAETLDAFSQSSTGDDPHPYIFLGADKASAVRSRFDALHELGHIVLHGHLDRKLFDNTKLHRMLELQCHRFAASFLLPAKSFMEELYAPTLSAFLTLKPRWKASIALMIKRCEQLGVLDEHQARRAWINLNRRSWRTQEPLDDRLPVEAPRLLSRSMKLLVDSGLKTKSQLLSDLALNSSDVEALTCLESGYFDSDQGIDLPRLRDSHEAGAVIPFSKARTKA